MSDEEVRVTSATGGQKGTKLARYGLIPTGPLKEVAEHFGKGALKYDDNNWRKGYDWHLSYDALQRHANAFWDGEDLDEETGSCHLAGVVFHALALMEFRNTHPEFDDRPTTKPSTGPEKVSGLRGYRNATPLGWESTKEEITPPPWWAEQVYGTGLLLK